MNGTRNTGALDVFEHGFRLGYAHGYDVGDSHGYNRHVLEITAVMTGVRQALGGPSQSDLDRARSTLRHCACNRCSACVRRAAIARNRARFGADDYPGANCTPSRNAARGAA